MGAFLLWVGIVFDTYVGMGASVEVRGCPPLCWVSFSIPMRAGEISSVVGILLGVPGIVFDTYVGVVNSL